MGLHTPDVGPLSLPHYELTFVPRSRCAMSSTDVGNSATALCFGYAMSCTDTGDTATTRSSIFALGIGGILLLAIERSAISLRAHYAIPGTVRRSIAN
eukprot:2329414-Rhodomonas_salina.2